MAKNVLYQVETPEECSRLEERINRLLELYGVECAGQICVKSGILDNEFVDIYPCKSTQIKDVLTIKKSPQGSLVEAKPEYLVLKIGETVYRIKYNPDKLGS